MNMLYNGEEFAVLPRALDDEYTHAMIFYASPKECVLVYSEQPITFDAGVIIHQLTYDYDFARGEWVFKEAVDFPYCPRVERIVWATYDVTDPNSGAVVAASDPLTIFAVTHTVQADLLERGVRPRVDVVQGDSLTRRIEFVLTAAGVPWEPPADATAAISYIRPDGVGRVYDKLPDGSTAYTVTDNRVRFTLLPEMLLVAGDVMAVLRLVRSADGAVLSSFAVEVVVHSEPSFFLKQPGVDPDDDPETAAAMYLYGTPSESGNIGLRNGDSVSYYDGAVLPESPVWNTTTHPYAVMLKRSKDINLYVSTSPLRFASGSMIYTTTSAEVLWATYTFASNEWGALTVKGSYSADSFVCVDARTPMWANYDFKQLNNGSTLVAKSEPVPVSGIVAYSYNGEIAGKLPIYDTEKYPYAIITNTNGRAMLWVLSGATFGWNEVAAEWRIMCDSYMHSTQSRVDYTKWGTMYSHDGGEFAVTSVKWANFDVLNSDGSVYLAASEPVPVYE